MKETWRWCKGFENFYMVSSYGRVKSVDCEIMRKDGKPLSIKGKILKANPNKRGYKRVTLRKNKKPCWRSVHRLVAEVFLDPPDGEIGSYANQYVINHKDGNKLNNHVDNLEYITNLENIKHARINGFLTVIGTKNGRSKVNDKKVKQIRKEYSNGSNQVTLAKKYGIDQTNISRIVRGDTWSHV